MTTQKAEELAARIMAMDICEEHHIIDALHEYGQAVRQRDAEIADDFAVGSLIAEAISKEPLP